MVGPFLCVYCTSLLLNKAHPARGGLNWTYYFVNHWQMDYNHYRPHSSLDYMAPAAFAAKCLEQGSATLRLTQDKENSCEILS
jgi:hypothetical protein